MFVAPGERRSHILPAGAMEMKGTGVLALGRAMAGSAIAKHRIKRVDRFLGNDKLERFAIAEDLFNILRNQDRHPIVLVDWTDRPAFEELVLPISRDGRSMPFHAITVKSTKLGTETHFIVVIIAYLLLCAFGAFAERKNFGEQLKANTEKSGALSLAAIGNHFMEFIGRTTMAMAKLVKAPT